MTTSCSTPFPCSTPPRTESGAGGLEVRVHGKAEDIAALAPEWRALLAKARPAHPFYDPAWHLAWWKSLGEGTPHICAVRRPDGSLLAVAPLALGEDGVLRFSGGSDVTDYLDIAAAEGDHEAAWGAILSHLEGPGAPPWKEMDLHCVPGGSPTLKLLLQTPERAEAEQEDVCPVIALPDSWDDYMGMLSGREERELRRKIRKANLEPGLEFQRTLTPEQLEADLDDFFRLHALSQPDKADFWTPGRRAFFREVAAEMLRLGWLDLTLMRVDGHAVGANFSFDYEDRIYLYNSGYDPGERELSGGVVLLARNIKEAIRAGRSAFDLLRGNEPYKYRFAAKDETVHRIRVRRNAE